MPFGTDVLEFFHFRSSDVHSPLGFRHRPGPYERVNILEEPLSLRMDPLMEVTCKQFQSSFWHMIIT